MKINLGYYSIAEGHYLSDNKTVLERCFIEDYFVVIGTIRKKISEDRDISPYRHHKILPYSKTYSDKNRLYIDIFEYRSFKLVSKIKDIYRPYGLEANDPKLIRYNTIKNVTQSMINLYMVEICRKYDIEDRHCIFLPGYFKMIWPLEVPQ